MSTLILNRGLVKKGLLVVLQVILIVLLFLMFYSKIDYRVLSGDLFLGIDDPSKTKKYINFLILMVISFTILALNIIHLFKDNKRIRGTLLFLYIFSISYILLAMATNYYLYPTSDRPILYAFFNLNPFYWQKYGSLVYTGIGTFADLNKEYALSTTYLSYSVLILFCSTLLLIPNFKRIFTGKKAIYASLAVLGIAFIYLCIIPFVTPTNTKESFNFLGTANSIFIYIIFSLSILTIVLGIKFKKKYYHLITGILLASGILYIIFAFKSNEFFTSSELIITNEASMYLYNDWNIFSVIHQLSTFPQADLPTTGNAASIELCKVNLCMCIVLYSLIYSVITNVAQYFVERKEVGAL